MQASVDYTLCAQLQYTRNVSNWGSATRRSANWGSGTGVQQPGFSNCVQQVGVTKWGFSKWGSPSGVQQAGLSKQGSASRVDLVCSQFVIKAAPAQVLLLLGQHPGGLLLGLGLLLGNVVLPFLLKLGTLHVYDLPGVLSEGRTIQNVQRQIYLQSRWPCLDTADTFLNPRCKAVQAALLLVRSVAPVQAVLYMTCSSSGCTDLRRHGCVLSRDVILVCAQGKAACNAAHGLWQRALAPSQSKKT